jgi:hypothetical protein
MTLMLMVSLAGGMPSAFATTKFGVAFDFTNFDGVDVGGAFLSFDVDPNNLPFNQWINLDTVTGFKMDAWVTTPDRNALTFTEQDRVTDEISDSLVYIENLNPIFPVTFGATFGSDLVSAFFYGAGPTFLTMEQYGAQHGTGSGVFNSSIGAGYWTVTAAWFDDPIPVTSVPEPAAFWLFGAGLLVLAAKARRRQVA